MDTIIQAATVIAAFAAMHERLLELLQQAARRWKWKRWSLEGEPRIDRWNIFLAFLLAIVTHANLVELFVKADGGTTSQFFKHYLAWPTAIQEWNQEAPSVLGGIWGRVVQEAGGFALMALSTALGSKFWHDLVKGLTDLRERAQSVQKAAEPVAHPALPPAEPQNNDSISHPSSGSVDPEEPPVSSLPPVPVL